MACSTFNLCSVIMAALSFSRQQDNTFADINGPHRRYSGLVRFFYSPQLRWGGILVFPMLGGSCYG
jgi:hypothetical protein